MAENHMRFGTKYVSWSDGTFVSENDAACLEIDLRLYGNAYVESIGGYGRRIAPQNLKMRMKHKGDDNARS